MNYSKLNFHFKFISFEMLVQNPNQTENYKPQTNLVNNIFIYKKLNLKKKRYVKFYLNIIILQTS